MKTEWLERGVIQLPRLCLCLTEKDFKRIWKELGVPQIVKWVTEGCGATCHSIDDDYDKLVCVIVCVDVEKANDAVELLGLIAHESLHVVQVMDYMGVSNDDIELPAVAEQVCFQRLVDEYCRQTGKELVFRKKKRK